MKTKPTPLECRDTALALTFLLMLVWYFAQNVWFAYAAMALLLLAMVWPGSLSLPARLWFGLSHVLSLVMNKVILGLLYFLVLLPIALIRRVMGKDAMRLRQWKNGADSLFVVRDHVYGKDDLNDAF